MDDYDRPKEREIVQTFNSILEQRHARFFIEKKSKKGLAIVYTNRK